MANILMSKLSHFIIITTQKMHTAANFWLTWMPIRLHDPSSGRDIRTDWIRACTESNDQISMNNRGIKWIKLDCLLFVLIILFRWRGHYLHTNTASMYM